MYKVTQHKNKTQQNKGDEDNKEVHCGFNRSSTKQKQNEDWKRHEKKSGAITEREGGGEKEKKR
jgi:hypothetical protein